MSCLANQNPGSVHSVLSLAWTDIVLAWTDIVLAWTDRIDVVIQGCDFYFKKPFQSFVLCFRFVCCFSFFQDLELCQW